MKEIKKRDKSSYQKKPDKNHLPIHTTIYPERKKVEFIISLNQPIRKEYWLIRAH